MNGSAVDREPPLALLLGLLQRARQAASRQELLFVIVNETFALFPYRQAVVWDQNGRVVALSGSAQIESEAPFVLWLRRLFRDHIATQTGVGTLQGEACPSSMRAAWQEWLPPHLLVLPLCGPNRQPLAWLALARDAEWQENEQGLLQELAAGYALVWAWWQPHTTRSTVLAYWNTIPLRKLGLLLALLLLTLLPVRLRILAPAELVARDPAIIRAPLDGIIDHVAVLPNQQIQEGELLLEMDTTTARNKVEVARKALTTARAEYERSAQLGFSDGKAKAQLAIIAGRIEERQSELALLSDQRQRSLLTAPRSGRVILDDPGEWVGRAVTVGERIFSIADAQDSEIEAWIAPADRIVLPAGAAVTLYLHVDPLQALQAKVRYITYETVQRSDGTLAYRLRATLNDQSETAHLGLKGTVRIEGETVTLFYWLLRRPMAILRQFFGV
ncbi:MAG: HlyD family efflux transporter periplasmic adaptor subunit [Magnetococcales bacterium]|nr:HlyD family efflux transporter periplasmic adaptor subunit [Magnetococcales bacterium]MBF0115036.1 HlyD family efflux transporter periplasmic adaptor subunit [Magnetococcales bacterium]